MYIQAGIRTRHVTCMRKPIALKGCNAVWILTHSLRRPISSKGENSREAVRAAVGGKDREGEQDMHVYSSDQAEDEDESWE
jgi:hypothetical protein